MGHAKSMGRADFGMGQTDTQFLTGFNVIPSTSDYADFLECLCKFWSGCTDTQNKKNLCLPLNLGTHMSAG